MNISQPKLRSEKFDDDDDDDNNNNNNNNNKSEKEKRTPKKNVDGRSTSSHDNKKFRTRSMEKQRGMAFVFGKMATAVKIPDR